MQGVRSNLHGSFTPILAHRENFGISGDLACEFHERSLQIAHCFYVLQMGFIPNEGGIYPHPLHWCHGKLL